MDNAKLESAFKLIKNSNGLPLNSRHIVNFDTFLRANDSSTSARMTYLITLRQLLVYAEQKRFEDLTTEDMMDFFEKVKSREFMDKKNERKKTDNLSDSSMMVRKSVVKKFLKWVYGFEEGYPDCVKWVKVRTPTPKKNFRDNLLTREEIFKMVHACDNARDRAMISVLWESGARISEFLSMRVKDVEFDQHGTIIRLPVSKTKPRKVRLIFSVTYISQWLENHPYKDDEEYPLWINIYPNKTTSEVRSLCARGIDEKKVAKILNIPVEEVIKRLEKRAIGKGAVNGILKRLLKRTGLKKRIYPHLLRHCRATDVFQILTEQEMKVMFGWSKSSNMASVYCHLNDADVGDKLLEKSGVKRPEHNLEERILNPVELRPRVCPRCDKKNIPNAIYCNCGQLLNQRHAFDMKDTEKAQGIQDSVMNQLAKDPEWLELTAKKIAEKGLVKALEPLMTRH